MIVYNIAGHFSQSANWCKAMCYLSIPQYTYLLQNCAHTEILGEFALRIKFIAYLSIVNSNCSLQTIASEFWKAQRANV